MKSWLQNPRMLVFTALLAFGVWYCFSWYQARHDLTYFCKEGNTKVFTGEFSECILGTRTALNDAQAVFRDAGKEFTLTYPASFVLYGGSGSTDLWRVQRTEKLTIGDTLLRIESPEDWNTNTNLRGVVLTLGKSNAPEAVVSCLAPEDQGVHASTATIHDVPFAKLSFSDAGAGNFYDTTSYRAVHDGSCYAIEYTVHSLNIYNFPEDAGIHEYDKGRVTRSFDSIAQSLVFL